MEDRYQLNDNELLYLYHQGDEEALETLINKYQRIMMACARRYGGRVKTSCEISDIYQIELIALYNAVSSYKENMGCRFGSYLKIVMERAVFNYFRHMHSDMSRANREAISIDQLISDCEGLYIVDTIATSAKDGNPEWQFHMKSKMEEIDFVLETCSEIEQSVYQLWKKGYSYREISLLNKIDEKKVDNILQQLKRKMKVFIGAD